MLCARLPTMMNPSERGAGAPPGESRGATGMDFTMRLRAMVVHGVLIGMLALTVALGLGAHEAAASKTVATTANCDSLMASAMYAGGNYLSASRRGNTIMANWWWSIYESYETAYVKA